MPESENQVHREMVNQEMKELTDDVLERIAKVKQEIGPARQKYDDLLSEQSRLLIRAEYLLKGEMPPGDL